MTRIPDSSLDFTGDLVYSYEGVPFTGVAYEADDSGRLISECTYVNGLQQGPSRSWYDTGQLESEEWFFENARHGTSREWYPNGQLKRDVQCEFGFAVSTREWSSEGVLVREQRLEPSDPNYFLLARVRAQRSNSSK